MKRISTQKNGNHRMYGRKFNYKNEPKCIKCSVDLVSDQEDDSYNWYPSRYARHEYTCSSCNAERTTYYYYLNQMKKNKIRIQEFTSQYAKSFSRIKAGFVYVLTNPAWPGWLKVGMAVDADDRCSSYQTSSPFRDFEIRYKRFFKNKQVAEKEAHALLSGLATDVNGEWFKATERNAKKVIDLL